MSIGGRPRDEREQLARDDRGGERPERGSDLRFPPGEFLPPGFGDDGQQGDFRGPPPGMGGRNGPGGMMRAMVPENATVVARTGSYTLYEVPKP